MQGAQVCSGVGFPNLEYLTSKDMPLRWIKVQWDHGEKKSYRVGAEGKQPGPESGLGTWKRDERRCKIRPNR